MRGQALSCIEEAVARYIYISLTSIYPCVHMLSDESIKELERHVRACDEARASLDAALDEADDASSAGSDAPLKKVAAILAEWQAAQRRFMQAVEDSEAPDAPMAALLLRNKEEIDATNARMGLPGAYVEGADQPFDMDMSGTRGQVLTTAAMEYLPDAEE